MFLLWDRNGFQRATHGEGLPGAGSVGLFSEMFHKELAFPKGVQMWLLSVSGPKVKVGEKRRD